MQLLVVQNGTVYESVGLAAGASQVRGVWKDTVLVIVIKHQARNLLLILILTQSNLSDMLLFINTKFPFRFSQDSYYIIGNITRELTKILTLVFYGIPYNIDFNEHNMKSVFKCLVKMA